MADRAHRRNDLEQFGLGARADSEIVRDRLGEGGLVAGDDGAQPLEPVAPKPSVGGRPLPRRLMLEVEDPAGLVLARDQPRDGLIGHVRFLPEHRHSRIRGRHGTF